jgi:hypothetical protein
LETELETDVYVVTVCTGEKDEVLERRYYVVVERRLMHNLKQDESATM